MNDGANGQTPERWANSLGMRFLAVRPGTFEMGSPRTEPRRFADETPRRTTLTQLFYLSKFPTTQAEWRAVVGTNPSKNRGVKRAPVERVSWIDCVDFIEKLNSEEYLLELTTFLGPEWRYGLPTEAQWEFACRAGTTTPYSFGACATGGEGAFGRLSGGASDGSSDGEEGNAGIVDGRKRVATIGGETTCEVGLFAPNPWGFCDMHGNVCEWTADRYGEYDPARSVDPTGPASGAERVARGGSWRSPVENCRSASRFNFLATRRGDDCGLRVGIFRLS
ncbi:MAG: formylglycine-generating enzyme family protein [Thermoguttaceae bacterium]|nr:formylglycine-generating enzyme family protein [Thermoguttaceae bacterium]